MAKPKIKKYPTGGTVKSISDFNKKYKTNYKNTYDFTGVNDTETQDFFKGIKQTDPDIHYALYKEHLAYGKPNVTKRRNPLPLYNKGRASYNSFNNTIYLHDDKELKGGTVEDKEQFRLDNNVSKYIAELAHSAQNHSSDGIKTKFVTKDVPAWIKNTYYNIGVTDNSSDEDFRNSIMSSPYETIGTTENQAHRIIEPFIKKDVQRKKQEYLEKADLMLANKKYKKGGTVPQYGNGSTIGSVLGAGVGALGFIGGPALGAMTTGLGMQLGEKVGSTFDNVDAINDPIKYDIPSITMKGLGTNQNIYAMGGMTGPNAEIELGEVARMPNGQTLIANAPSHENGGLQLNLPMGTQISSDRFHISIEWTRYIFCWCICIK